MRSSATCAAGTDCSPSSSWSRIARRASRSPPWPAHAAGAGALVKAALAAGVSFATRGNLLILAPPLVIEEQELADALRAARYAARPFLSARLEELTAWLSD